MLLLTAIEYTMLPHVTSGIGKGVIDIHHAIQHHARCGSNGSVWSERVGMVLVVMGQLMRLIAIVHHNGRL